MSRHKAQNSIKLTLQSKSINEGFARSAVAAFASQLDPTISEMADLKTAVSEAVTNCIVHAYRGGMGEIYISCEYDDSRKIKAIRGFDLEHGTMFSTYAVPLITGEIR